MKKNIARQWRAILPARQTTDNLYSLEDVLKLINKKYTGCIQIEYING